MKKLLVVLLSVLFVFSAFTFTASAEPAEPFDEALNNLEEAIPEDFRNAMQAQQQALEAYQNLWNSFPKDELGEPFTRRITPARIWTTTGT